MIPNRHQENIELLRLLRILIDKYPDQRFGQLLINYVFLPLTEEYINERHNDLIIWSPETNQFIKRVNECICSER